MCYSTFKHNNLDKLETPLYFDHQQFIVKHIIHVFMFVLLVLKLFLIGNFKKKICRNTRFIHFIYAQLS